MVSPQLHSTRNPRRLLTGLGMVGRGQARPLSQVLALGTMLLLTMLSTGCWAGRRMWAGEFEYRHTAVRWVYTPGGQIGRFILFPVPVENSIHGVLPTDGYLIVSEGVVDSPVVGGHWDPEWTLDVRTGLLAWPKPAAGNPVGLEMDFLPDHGGHIGVLDKDTIIHVPYHCYELRIGRTGVPYDRFTLILALPKSKWQLGDRWIYAVRPGNGTLVVGTDYYLVCLDEARLRDNLVEPGQPWPKLTASDVPTLIQDLKAKAAYRRRAAVKALARMGPEAKGAAAALVRLMKKADGWHLRKDAYRALVGIGRPAVPHLIAAMNHSRGGYSIAALGEIGPQAHEATGALIEALRDPKRGVQYSAATALGRIHAARMPGEEIGPAAKDVIPALREALKDEEQRVREAAAAALKKIQEDGSR